MARAVPSTFFEREPHTHGARPDQYRFGLVAGTAKQLPYWEPGLAHDGHYLYYVGHRLPNTRGEYVQLQQAIFRERILEGSAFDFMGGGGQTRRPRPLLCGG